MHSQATTLIVFPDWERCRSSELPWWKALTEGFTRCRFHVAITDRKLEEVLAWFSQAMGPTLAVLYCAVGPEWITKVIQSGSSRWKPQHYQLMKKQKPKRPVFLEGDMNRTGQELIGDTISAGEHAGAPSRG